MIFSGRFDTMHGCDRQTEGQTPADSIAWRGKLETTIKCKTEYVVHLLGHTRRFFCCLSVFVAAELLAASAMVWQLRGRKSNHLQKNSSAAISAGDLERALLQTDRPTDAYAHASYRGWAVQR